MSDLAQSLPLDVLDVLSVLVEKSLVIFDDSHGQARYRLSETARQYAREQLVQTDAPEAVDTLRNKHAAYFWEFACNAAPHLHTAMQPETLRRLQADAGNLTAALEWLPVSNPENALHLAADLSDFWRVRSLLSEGRAQMRRILEAPETQISLPLQQNHEIAQARGRALNGAGNLALLQADYEEAACLHEEARTLFNALPNEDALGLSDALHGLGNVVYYEKRYAEARALWSESLDLREQTGDKRRIAASLHSLGNLAMREDNDSESLTYLSRALVLRRELGEPTALAGTLGGLGQLHFSMDNLPAARKYAGEALQIFAGLGVWWAVALALSDMARIAEAEACLDNAAVLLAASSRLRETVGFPHPPAELGAARQRKEDLRAALGAEAFSAAWEIGQESGAEEMVAFALRV